MTKNIQWKKSTIDYSYLDTLNTQKLLAIKLGPEGLIAKSKKGAETLGFEGCSDRAKKVNEILGKDGRCARTKKMIKNLGEKGLSDRAKKIAKNISDRKTKEKIYALTFLPNEFTEDDVLEIIKQNNLKKYLRWLIVDTSLVIKIKNGNRYYRAIYKKLDI